MFWISLLLFYAVQTKIESVSIDLRNVVIGDQLTMVKCVESIVEEPNASNFTFKLKVNGKIRPTSGFKSLQDTKLVYITHVVFTSDDVTIQCVLRGDIHKSKTSEIKKLDVMFGPRQISENSTFYVELKESVTIDVDVASNPAPNNYKFSHGELDLTKQMYIHSILQLSNTTATFLYQISDAGYEDSGKHTLSLGNGIGCLVNIDLHVVVLGPPQPPTEVVHYSMTLKSLILAWKSGANGGSQQIFFIEYKEEHETFFTSINNTITDPGYSKWATYTVTGLNPYRDYLFRVKAKNNYLRGNYSYSAEHAARITGRSYVQTTRGGEIGLIIALTVLLVIMTIIVVLLLLKTRGTGVKESYMNEDTSTKLEEVEVPDNEQSTAGHHADVSYIHDDFSPEMSTQDKVYNVITEINKADTQGGVVGIMKVPTTATTDAQLTKGHYNITSNMSRQVELKVVNTDKDINTTKTQEDVERNKVPDNEHSAAKHHPEISCICDDLSQENSSQEEVYVDNEVADINTQETQDGVVGTIEVPTTAQLTKVHYNITPNTSRQGELKVANTDENIKTRKAQDDDETKTEHYIKGIHKEVTHVHYSAEVSMEGKVDFISEYEEIGTIEEVEPNVYTELM